MNFCVDFFPESVDDLAEPALETTFEAYDETTGRVDEITESAGVDPQGSTGSYVDFVASNYQYADEAAYELGLIDKPETDGNSSNIWSFIAIMIIHKELYALVRRVVREPLVNSKTGCVCIKWNLF